LTPDGRDRLTAAPNAHPPSLACQAIADVWVSGAIWSTITRSLAASDPASR